VGDLLRSIDGPADLRKLGWAELDQLAAEMRLALRDIVTDRSAHFASNLGVVELCLALHRTFDFSRDRLIWDTGHQIYPHKLVTGRQTRFRSIRQRGGLMGYPNPNESPYDLFMTGHAGASLSTALGLTVGDGLIDRSGPRPEAPPRRTVAVIGDGALVSGIVFEAMNHAAELDPDLIVILNDNQMSISPRVGGIGQYLDKARMTSFYTEVKRDIHYVLNQLPVLGPRVNRVLGFMRDAAKGALVHGMLFEHLGFTYIGPIDGHDLPKLCDYFERLPEQAGPLLLHVLTEKGHGFEPASANPTAFHAPPPFHTVEGKVVKVEAKPEGPSYTQHVANAVLAAAEGDGRVAAITAAMCEGTKLGEFRDRFPDRFFDVGICESHAVAFAAGLAKTGMRPIVAIYSTFMQRSFDQIFQELALQNLPVILCLDRAGLTGPDGPTHHGVFDVSYLRMFPNLTILAPGDALDVAPMIQFALEQDGPVAIRYPKAPAQTVARSPAPIESGKAEVIRWGADGLFVAFGAMLPSAIAAAELLARDGLDLGVVNARFAKPLDADTILGALDSVPMLVTVEEHVLAGGFGSALLEAAHQRGVDTRRIGCAAIGDAFVEHGPRSDLLMGLHLDPPGLAQCARELARRLDLKPRPKGKGGKLAS
jgi:1-deoxy-D-xylulose-5-phosphate synthase